MPVNVTFKEPEKRGFLYMLYMIGMVLAGCVVNTPGAIWYLIKKDTNE